MQLVTRIFPGRMFICEECGALHIGIQESDIYAKNIVYCLNCKHGNYLEYDKSYNGVVKENDKSSSNA